MNLDISQADARALIHRRLLDKLTALTAMRERKLSWDAPLDQRGKQRRSLESLRVRIIQTSRELEILNYDETQPTRDAGAGADIRAVSRQAEAPK